MTLSWDCARVPAAAPATSRLWEPAITIGISVVALFNSPEPAPPRDTEPQTPQTSVQRVPCKTRDGQFLSLCEPPVDVQVLTFDQTRLTEAGPERLYATRRGGRGTRVENADPIDRPRRLRLGGERRGEEAAGDRRKESPPIHYWITSSARASSAGASVRPRVLAVLRFTTSWNLDGRCTGRSAGLAPFRI